MAFCEDAFAPDDVTMCSHVPDERILSAHIDRRKIHQNGLMLVRKWSGVFSIVAKGLVQSKQRKNGTFSVHRKDANDALEKAAAGCFQYLNTQGAYRVRTV
ncbi:hypothetical protein AAGS40_30095 (plasmid) [Paraburkholderia sp. PREW-6R]|uniref:hypothetical protein n=1 Tax=Paraburkholderia sp. PREW-6R TaxID=3141544 RepID=UPI0031F4F5BF